ncbi:hypothetical protein Taro_045629 [Colocasia esculenta]|uniref:Uncharacterized protein n=1 Tax=Colocasia esculenta TaxID=4460 RepID=A0A843X6P6_COLES|nr:hypothetical protein [Colocasia esculenta]
MVAPVFRELRCLGGCVCRGVCFRMSSLAFAVVGAPAPLAGKGLVASSLAVSECELQESVAAIAGCACCEQGCWFTRAALGWVRPRPAHPRGCVAKVERACVWCDLPRCRAVLLVDLVEGVLALLALPLLLGYSRSSSLLVLVEVRFPQNCVVLVSGCCGIALWVENDALVVLVEVLPEPVVLLPLSVVFSLLAICLGLHSGDVFPERILALWVEVLPKPPYFSRLCWWDFVCLQGREVGFISRALWALPDGSLRLIVRVSFPCFPLVARGDVAPLWCCVARVRIVTTFGWSHHPLSCFVLSWLLPLFRFSLVGYAGGTICGSLWLSLWFLAFSCQHTLADGGLASVVGVRLAVPPLRVLALRCCFLCFPWFAWGGGAFTWHLVPCHAPWRPLW